MRYRPVRPGVANPRVSTSRPRLLVAARARGRCVRVAQAAVALQRTSSLRTRLLTVNVVRGAERRPLQLQRIERRSPRPSPRLEITSLVAGQAKLFSKLAVRLRPFLRSPIDAEQAQAMCKHGLADRAASFLRLTERGVYPDHDSPYRRS